MRDADMLQHVADYESELLHAHDEDMLRALLTLMLID